MSFPRELVAALLGWYRRSRRDLPWRRTSDPYAIWVSEVMLQQTRVDTVVPYFLRWLAAFPDAAALAAAPEERVLKLWEGLGYYSRARHLQKAARILVAEHGGRLPPDPAAVLGLPGIGEYIAAAVLSIAFGAPEAAVDGNVVRVVSRLRADEADASTPAFRRGVKALLEASFHGFPPGEVNQAWMELGALVCRPRPACGVCPLAAFCRAHALGRETDFPVKPRRRPVPLRRGVIAWLPRTAGGTAAAAAAPEGSARKAPGARPDRDRPLLLVRRASRGLLGGLWELPNWELPGPEPGGAGAPPEDDPFDFARLEPFCRARGVRLLGDTGVEVRHGYSHFSVAYRVWRAELSAPDARLDGWVEQRWVPPAELADYPRPRVHILAMERLGLLAAPPSSRRS